MYFAVLFLIFETYASVVNFQNLLYLKMFSVPYVLICIMSFWFKCYLISIVTSLTNNILGVSFIISNQMEKFYFNFGLTFNACMLSLQLCSTLQPHGLQSTRLLCPRDSPDKKPGVSCHALLQGSLPDPRIKLVSLMSHALPEGSLPLAPQFF